MVSAPPAVYLRAVCLWAVYLREMNTAGEKRLVSVVIDAGRGARIGAVLRSLITKESVH